MAGSDEGSDAYLSDLTSGRDISCLFGCAARGDAGRDGQTTANESAFIHLLSERGAYYRYVGVNKYPLMAQSEHDRQLGQYAGFAILP